MLYPIKIVTAENLEIKNSEILRYMGYGRKDKAEDGVITLIEKCKEHLINETSYKACVTEVPLIIDNGEIDLGFKTKSKALLRNLNGCSKAVLFCATVGAGADRLILRYTKTEPLRAVIYDAVATAMIEEFCDYISKMINGRPRFSCGFGDFGIEYQKEFIKILDAGRKIGVTLSSGNLMVPTKTVTAVIGIEE